jgi:hypothetical protein
MSVLDQSNSEHRTPEHSATTATATNPREQIVSSAQEQQANSLSISDTTTERLSNDSGNEMEAIAESEYVFTRPPPVTLDATYEIAESTCGASSVEEGTIDAAVVEEIVDEEFVPSPPLSSSPLSNELPRNSSAEAHPVVATNNMIPEVEPEVDIEEIHVRYDASHISAVSALTTTSNVTFDAGDSKLPATSLVATEATTPRYSPIAAPPLMPHRQPMIPEYCGFSAGTALSQVSRGRAEPREELAMSPTVVQSEDLPDYKDQSRPRIPSGSPLSSRNASNNSGSNNTGGSSHPSGRPYSGQRLSSGAIGVEDQEHIPVVDAILVPAERLAAEEQAIQQLRYSQRPSSEEPQNSSGSSSGASTLSTSHTSSNQVSDGSNNSSNHLPPPANGENASRSKSSENAGGTSRPISERRFWVTIIVAALLLNSLLVAGAVVGGFCAAGKCRSSGSPPDRSSSTNGGGVPPLAGNVSSAPSPSPSRSLSRTFVPTVATTGVSSLPPNFADFVPQTPTRSPAPIGFFGKIPTAPTMSPQPFVFDLATLSPTLSPQPINLKYSPSLGSNAPADIGTTVASLVPSSTYVPTLGVAVDPPNGREPSAEDDVFVSIAPSVSPTAKPTNLTASDSTTHSSDGVSLAVLIPILVGLEAIIMVGLFTYYRWWKRQKEFYSDYDSILAPETTATDSSNGIAGATSPPPLCNTSRSSTGSSGPALPTIEECESLDHDQYSV